MAQKGYFGRVVLLPELSEVGQKNLASSLLSYQTDHLQDAGVVSLGPWCCEMFSYFEGSQTGRIERGVVIGGG